ncbi:(2Fe-2S)-binding protein [Deinococcus roseus]|uniref:(2Fe-2S)-binding protein n=1 Tax=Deinococcus roseus TaxID=392414 RepID=A0ABQ2CYU1_9DEIO|nr:(2Fe-2S)-binding protein [Deinococcus roseus]GGJ29694.1 (2Fe-2S)-binding protein [Deinococcus roseus]
MPEIQVNGQPLNVKAGISVLAALQNQGIWTTRTSVSGEPRGALCGMGVCFECRLQVDGKIQKACQLMVQQGMKVVLDAR